jgi:site-specific recombinase XerD
MPRYVYFPLHRVWNDCTLAFLAHLESLSGSHNTVRAYHAILKQFFADPRKTPDQYTRADVESYLASPGRGQGNRGQPISASTRYGRLAVLASFYHFSENWIVASPEGRQRLLQSPPPAVSLLLIFTFASF